MKHKQLPVFLVLLQVYAFRAFATYTFFTNDLAALDFGDCHLGAIFFLAGASSFA